MRCALRSNLLASGDLDIALAWLAWATECNCSETRITYYYSSTLRASSPSYNTHTRHAHDDASPMHG